MTGTDRRKRSVRRRRAALAGVTAAAATATGLYWWALAGRGVDVDVEVDITREGAVVSETIRFDPDALGEEHLRREIDGDVTLGAVWADDHDDVVVLPRPDDGLTVLIEAGAGTPVGLGYEVDGADLGTLNADAVVRIDGGPATTVDAGDPLAGGDAGDDAPTALWNALGLTAGALAAAAWFAARRSGGRGAATPVDADDGDLPSAHSPAEVGWLLRHGRVTFADLAATVVDLTARGHVLPFRREGELVLGRGRPGRDLAAHEALVLDWLFAGDAREADLAAARTAISADPDRWSDLWATFLDDVEGAGRGSGLLEHDIASTPVLVAAGAGLAVVVAGTVGLAHGYPGWLAAIAAGAWILAGAAAVARRTAEGEALADRWEAFGAGLHDADRTLTTPHALAYAVALGEEQAATALLESRAGTWPAQLIHDEVERHVLGWREAYLAATSVRGQPSARVRAFLRLRRLRAGKPPVS